MRCTMHYAVKAENDGMCNQVRIRCGCSSSSPGTGIGIVPRMCRTAWSRSWRSLKVHKVRRKKKLDRGRGTGSWRKFSVKRRRQIRLQSSSSCESEHQLGTHADCSKTVTNADEQGNSLSMKATVNLLDFKEYVPSLFERLQDDI